MEGNTTWREFRSKDRNFRERAFIQGKLWRDADDT